VGISSIVISAYFLLGLSDTVDKNSVFTPSTFIYLLSMLNNPLNALSWYIAGIKTAERAIKEIENDVRLSEESG
jgi:ABC-type multidrug transport system fused ATPase/permease subunit